MSRSRRLWLLFAALASVAGRCGGPPFELLEPAPGLLADGGGIDVSLQLPERADLSQLSFFVDDAPVVPVGLARAGDVAKGRIGGLADGMHSLRVVLSLAGELREQSAGFELVTLNAPDDCEILNDAECLYPYPSWRFLRPDPTSATDLRVDLPAASMPEFVVGSVIGFLGDTRQRLDPTPYNQLDGFSPTVQLLTHFPAGVDLALSNAARLDPVARNFDLRSLDASSPTVIVDAHTGERIAHFVENDDRATGGRVATILRPAKSLLPGHRYLVAVRGLKSDDGSDIEPEAVFEALRDGRPSAIGAVEARRDHAEDVFERLASHGVPRGDLLLAFDFVVQSDQGLTEDLVAMRDQAFDFIDASGPASLVDVQVALEITPTASCGPDALWKLVSGTFTVPNFLSWDRSQSPPPPADPVNDPDVLGVLARDAFGAPLQTGTYQAKFAFGLPCSAITDAAVRPLVFGHGLFGNGPGQVGTLMIDLLPRLEDLKQRGLVSADLDFDFGATATHWSGLSSLDVRDLPTGIDFDDLSPADLLALLDFAQSFIGQIFVDFDAFEALPDRLRQGQVATLVLTRLLERGAFNALSDFQVPPDAPLPQGQGVLTTGEVHYFGASLGGIMGLLYSALTPDVERANVDVPAMNFSLLLQRAKPFKPFQTVLEVIDPDPMRQLVGLGLLHELWVKGEPAGYAHHITGNTLAPLPGTNPKQILMTVARFDQQVSTLGAQIAAATLDIPNLAASAEVGLPLLPDATGPVGSAHVLYDTGSYEIGVDGAFIPPLANRPAALDDNQCDPHTLRALIPASLEQLVRFLAPDGRVENFCDGRCDATGARELPEGLAAPCEP